MRERAAETKGEGQRQVEEESLSMRMWKQMIPLETIKALFDLPFRRGVLIHNYSKESVMLT